MTDIVERGTKALEGVPGQEWRHGHEDLRGGRYWCVYGGGPGLADGIHEDDAGEAITRFIAFARTGVPELLEEVKRLREENERLKGRVAHAPLGHGSMAINHGTYYDTPAVFIEPLDHSGPIGDAVKPAMPKNELRPGAIVITFASEGGFTVLTEEMAKARALLPEVTP